MEFGCESFVEMEPTNQRGVSHLSNVTSVFSGLRQNRVITCLSIIISFGKLIKKTLKMWWSLFPVECTRVVQFLASLNGINIQPRMMLVLDVVFQAFIWVI